MIEMSVICPLYRAAPIGWFGIESLCHQKGVDFEWELIIAEEKDPLPMGINNILKYKDRLKEAGCAAIKYISIPYWIPLSMKYKIMSESCAESKVFFIQVADYWSPPHRMKKTLSLFGGKIDWVHGDVMLMYDINSDKVFSRDKNPKKFWMSLNMDLAKKLPLSSKKKGCDQYLIDSCVSNKKGPLIMACCSDWGMGIVVHGLNNLSNNFAKFRAVPTDISLTDIVPDYIASKLKDSFIDSWEIKIPKHNIPKKIPKYSVETYKL